jgi:carboxyl-terminal processing protease
MFAPRRNEARGGPFRRFMRATGRVSSAVTVMTVIALVVFLGNFFFSTPTGLYHRTWERAAQHYFDPTAMGDWKSWEHKYDSQIHSNEDAIKYANEMLRSLNDRYTYLMSPEQVAKEKESGQGNFSGVGMVFEFQRGPDGKPVLDAQGNPSPQTDKDGHPLIAKVMKGAPAELAGIRAGDALVAIDGQSTKNQSLEWLITHVRGQNDTAVKLTVRRQGQDIDISVKRGTVNVPAVTTQMLPGDIGYLRLEDFGQFDAADEVADGLRSLNGAKAIIFDLRGNPGGYVHNAINIASLFVEHGTLVVVKSRVPGDPAHPDYETNTVKVDRNGLHEESTSTRNPNQVDASTQKRYPYLLNGRPVVILVNGNSASASEMTTGAIADNKAATVIGTRTFGKGIGQSSITMPNGTQLHITSLRYYSPNGNWYGDGGNSIAQGIQPDIVVRPAKQFFELGGADDNQLHRAVEFLNSKLNP